MKSEVIKVLLKHINSTRLQDNGSWITASCPLACWTHKSGHDNNPSFGIKVEDKKPSYFNCWGCNKGGSLEALMLELLHLSKENTEGLNIAEAYKLIDADELTGFHVSDWSEFTPAQSKEQFQPWEEQFLDSFIPANKSIKALEYLASRHIGLSNIKQFDIRFDTGRETVGFPFRNYNHKLAGMRGRYINPINERRYHDYDWFNFSTLKKINNTKHVWFNEHLIDWDKTIVIAEGAFDVVAIYQEYQNVMSPLSASMSFEKIDRLKQAVKILCFFDNDLAGETAYRKILTAVNGDVVVKKVTYPEGTPIAADASAISRSTLQAMLIPFVKLNSLINY